MAKYCSLLLTGLLLFACGQDQGGTDDSSDSSTPPEVATIKMRYQPLSSERRWVGQLEPVSTLVISAPTDGLISGIQVRNGQTVRAGDILLRIDNPDLSARIQALSEREANLEAQVGRLENLSASAVTRAEIDEARIRLLETRESLASTRARIAANTLRAPADGVVVNFYQADSHHVGAGDTLLHLEDSASWGARFSIASRETHRLGNLDELALTSPRNTELDITGVVLEPTDHTGFVRAIVYARADELQRQEVSLTHKDEDSVLLLPWTSVANDETGSWVARINPDDGTLERRQVQLGRAHATGVEVRSGLSEGDIVVRYEPRAFAEGRTLKPRLTEL